MVVPATEWAWWSDTGNETRSPESQRGNFANSARRLAPYQGRHAPGRRWRRGHPRHSCVAGLWPYAGPYLYLIADGNAQAMFVADTHQPARTDWPAGPTSTCVFDFDAEDGRNRPAIRSTTRVATDRIRITGYHFPFPANGYMAKEGSGYRFVPAD